MFAVNSALLINQTDMLANPYRPPILHLFGYKQHSSELSSIMDHPCEIWGFHGGDCEDQSLLYDAVTFGKCVHCLLNDTVNFQEYIYIYTHTHTHTHTHIYIYIYMVPVTQMSTEHWQINNCRAKPQQSEKPVLLPLCPPQIPHNWPGFEHKSPTSAATEQPSNS